ncbi:MAG: inositol monophosphatase family protein [Candidatus Hodarchaeota archaeon]
MNWLEKLEEIAIKVHDVVKPLLGTEEASRNIGKGAGGDVSKEIDIVAERMILEELQNLNETIMVITEEKGELLLNPSTRVQEYSYHAIIDPIDGSFNATSGVPIAAISIAISNGPQVKDITDAVVLNVYTGDIYKASRGKGAWLNERRLVLKNAKEDLDGIALGIDLNPKNIDQGRMDYINELEFILDTPKKIRVLGCNAIGTCLVATGALDCFIDIRGNLRFLDIAAAWLIVKEAGGMVYDWAEGEMNPMDKLNLKLKMKIQLLAVSNDELTRDIMKRFKEFENK